MRNYMSLAAAGPMFFVSAWLLMLITGAVHTDIGVAAFGYGTAMVFTIGLWLAVAPAIGAVARTGRPRDRMS
jgi:hypothetical protein